MSRDVSSRARRVHVRRKRSERLDRRDPDRAPRFRHHKHARRCMARVVMFVRVFTRTGVIIAVGMIVARRAGHRLRQLAAVAHTRGVHMVPAAPSHDVEDHGHASQDVRQTVHNGPVAKCRRLQHHTPASLQKLPVGGGTRCHRGQGPGKVSENYAQIRPAVQSQSGPIGRSPLAGPISGGDRPLGSRERARRAAFSPSLFWSLAVSSFLRAVRASCGPRFQRAFGLRAGFQGAFGLGPRFRRPFGSRARWKRAPR